MNDFNKNNKNIYTIEEEMLTYSLEENNNFNNNHLYDKMKGSDININSNYNSCRFFNSNNSKVMQKAINLNVNNNNLSSDFDNNNDIDIKINTN